MLDLQKSYTAKNATFTLIDERTDLPMIIKSYNPVRSIMIQLQNTRTTRQTDRLFGSCSSSHHCPISRSLFFNNRQSRQSRILLRRLTTHSQQRKRIYLSDKNERKCSSTVHSSSPSSDANTLVSTNEVEKVDTTERLKALRNEMRKENLVCYIVPSQDEHQSEYVSVADERRRFISGFSGSAGIACVTRSLNHSGDGDAAALSTDGRYFNQAGKQLDHNWQLIKQGTDNFTWQEWCIKKVKEMADTNNKEPLSIGIDPKLISYESVTLFKQLLRETADTNSIKLKPVDRNLIDSIWNDFEPKPIRPKNKLILLPFQFHGEHLESKRKRVFEYIRKKYPSNGTTNKALIVVALDDICWFLNLRGSDIAYNPCFFSYLIIHENEIVLFTDNPISKELLQYLKENNVTVKPYNSIWVHLTKIDYPVFAPKTSSWKLIQSIPLANSECTHKSQIIPSIIEALKAVKNPIEISNARIAQRKDALSIIKYFAWLEKNLLSPSITDDVTTINEYEGAEYLRSLRMETQPTFMGNSFETISSSGSNAAIIHYSPTAKNSSIIDPTKIYLCDTGGQYLEGTTDITRTIHFTEPSDEERRNYTLVLKGNLSLERFIFIEGTSGEKLDAIARQHLWSNGLNYRHGTSHGIGSFLNVHEGPIGIGTRSEIPLKVGNIVSNEPGYYKDDCYGIRIENDVCVKKIKGLQFDGTPFLTFENLTLVPYCSKLIDVTLLTNEERNQINWYHQKIWNNLKESFDVNSDEYKWLQRETTPL
ncbi:uncharacterized protein NDAI_0H00330 [Naumovozyma dairenensis CBS 421]|uniref:Xaa-Pro aminopeptidase n=1 Tax=Naumovozyma dairenensis (strain ATCC 10597 / BCRC 20456 / CBS 421 / NBRC 0211 / NRRL Y-12639) TaxID=1071378 RepID=G0WEJ6_NAUDC|nr:hypothetical protein NDAI_0H00330 [Naumovozyma dairenensis CBS 421]CCD26207.1 hypothetical protein NDAI_0H00330 [Naumovozyma dairenensis CBS 421]